MARFTVGIRDHDRGYAREATQGLIWKLTKIAIFLRKIQF